MGRLRTDMWAIVVFMLLVTQLERPNFAQATSASDSYGEILARAEDAINMKTQGLLKPLEGVINEGSSSCSGSSGCTNYKTCPSLPLPTCIAATSVKLSTAHSCAFVSNATVWQDKTSINVNFPAVSPNISIYIALDPPKGPPGTQGWESVPSPITNCSNFYTKNLTADLLQRKEFYFAFEALPGSPNCSLPVCTPDNTRAIPGALLGHTKGCGYMKIPTVPGCTAGTHIADSIDFNVELPQFTKASFTLAEQLAYIGAVEAAISPPVLTAAILSINYGAKSHPHVNTTVIVNPENVNSTIEQLHSLGSQLAGTFQNFLRTLQQYDYDDDDTSPTTIYVDDPIEIDAPFGYGNDEPDNGEYTSGGASSPDDESSPPGEFPSCAAAQEVVDRIEEGTNCPTFFNPDFGEVFAPCPYLNPDAPNYLNEASGEVLQGGEVCGGCCARSCDPKAICPAYPTDPNGCGPVGGFREQFETNLITAIQAIVGGDRNLFTTFCNTHDICYGSLTLSGSKTKADCDTDLFTSAAQLCAKIQQAARSNPADNTISTAYIRCKAAAALGQSFISKSQIAVDAYTRAQQDTFQYASTMCVYQGPGQEAGPSADYGGYPNSKYTCFTSGTLSLPK